MRLLLVFILLVSLVVPAAAQTGWQLVWSDEFTGAANAAPDTAKWAYDLGTGSGGWGNAELERYTNSTDNAFLDGKGNLVIRALHPDANTYTSARLKTQGKYTLTYGRVEARLRVPYGQGIWPAFWMLGNDITTAGWPGCGEIDIMENIGKEPFMVHGSLHGPGYSGGNPITSTYTLPGGAKFSDDFHVFAVEWKQDSAEFFVDGTSYLKATPASLPAGTKWVFDKPFFILMNLAVGGRWPGYPDSTSVFPQELTVDYVRVFRSTDGPAIHSGGILNGASFGTALAPGSLASLFGVGLASTAAGDLFDLAAGAFPTSALDTTVTVNAVAAPLTYLSPAQVNFQIPWETPLNVPVPVRVTAKGATSDAEMVTLQAAAPSAFGINGVAILTCVGGAPKPGAVCTIWGNGFGAKVPAQRSGAPAGVDPLPVVPAKCELTIGGVAASNVSYCGSAPYLVIDQLNFTYPAGISQAADALPAVLTIGGISGELQVPYSRQ